MRFSASRPTRPPADKAGSGPSEAHEAFRSTLGRARSQAELRQTGRADRMGASQSVVRRVEADELRLDVIAPRRV